MISGREVSRPRSYELERLGQDSGSVGGHVRPGIGVLSRQHFLLQLGSSGGDIVGRLDLRTGAERSGFLGNANGNIDLWPI